MPQTQKEGHRQRQGENRNTGARTSGKHPSKPEVRESSAEQTAELIEDAKAFKK